jgi:hypothetical protein
LYRGKLNSQQSRMFTFDWIKLISVRLTETENANQANSQLFSDHFPSQKVDVESRLDSNSTSLRGAFCIFSVTVVANRKSFIEQIRPRRSFRAFFPARQSSARKGEKKASQSFAPCKHC